MQDDEIRIFIKTAIEHLEIAKDELYSITMDATVNIDVEEFITDVISNIQEIIDILDPDEED